MARRRVWIEIFVLSATVACGLALLLAMFGAATAAEDSAATPQPSPNPALVVQTAVAASPVPSPQQQGQIYEGMVTDTRCEAKHEAAIGKTASECARACVHAGAQFALVNGDKMYILTGDLEMLKRSAGRRAKILGTLANDSIAVSSISAGN